MMGYDMMAVIAIQFFRHQSIFQSHSILSSCTMLMKTSNVCVDKSTSVMIWQTDKNRPK